MTKTVEGQQCGWCGRSLDSTQPKGRPRVYCKDSCRQRAYELRRRQRAGTLSAEEIPVPISRWRELQDRLWELSAAVEDVENDLADDRSPGAYREAFRHLFQVASRLKGFDLTTG